MIVQIYAFTDVETAVVAAQLGVNHIGFVAGKYGEVPAELSFQEAYAIAAALPPETVAVALTMAIEVNEILQMAREVKPDVVHISSDLDCVGVDKMRELKSQLDQNIRLMKAIPVEGEASIAIAKQYAQVSDLLLLDTKRSDFPGVGATGSTHDWNISRRIIEAVKVPVILAGGLTPQNVGTAINITHPYGVDSNTSTNIPGSNTKKDIQRMAEFVKAVRIAENEQKNELSER